MPADYAAFGESWKTQHPDWQIKLWGDSEIHELIDPRLLNPAPSLASMSDLARYEILRRYGGVYIDTDFECLRNIECIIREETCFAAQESLVRIGLCEVALVNNAILGAIPNHPFLNELVAQAHNYMLSMPPACSAATLTGPYYLTSVIQGFPAVKVFPASYFYPYGPTER